MSSDDVPFQQCKVKIHAKNLKNASRKSAILFCFKSIPWAPGPILGALGRPREAPTGGGVSVSVCVYSEFPNNRIITPASKYTSFFRGAKKKYSYILVWGPMGPHGVPMGPHGPRFFFRLFAPVLFSAFGPSSFFCFGLRIYFRPDVFSASRYLSPLWPWAPPGAPGDENWGPASLGEKKTELPEETALTIFRQRWCARTKRDT